MYRLICIAGICFMAINCIASTGEPTSGIRVNSEIPCKDTVGDVPLKLQLNELFMILNTHKDNLNNLIQNIHNHTPAELKQFFDSYTSAWRRLEQPLNDQNNWFKGSLASMEETRFSGIAHDLRGALHVGAMILSMIKYYLTQPEFRGTEFQFNKTIDMARDLYEVQESAAWLIKYLMVPNLEPQITIVTMQKLLSSVSARLTGIPKRFVLNLPHNVQDLSVHGNRQLLADAITNLLRNSMDHGYDESQDPAPIFVRISSVNNEVIIEVGDNGKGIPENMRDSIFTPGVTSATTARNTGLGLAQVKHIIEVIHGGKVEILPQSKGSTFRITLKQVTDTTDISNIPMYKGHEILTNSVLLIEDDVLSRTSLEMLLKMYGFNVLSVSKSSEALDILKDAKDRISLIVTDRSAIQKSIGYKENWDNAGNAKDVQIFIEEAHKANPKIKIGLLSGWSDDAMCDKGLFDFVDPKPIAMEVDLPGVLRSVYSAMGKEVPPLRAD